MNHLPNFPHFELVWIVSIKVFNIKVVKAPNEVCCEYLYPEYVP